jgi:peptidylprolyl isomerase
VPVGALVAPALLLPLAACGATEMATAEGSEAYEIVLDDDGAPQVEWSVIMDPGEEREVEVLVTGDGPAVADGDRVMVNVLLSNGFTHRTPVNTFAADQAGASVEIGAGEPTTYADLLLGTFSEELGAGTTIGTRVAVTASAETAFGDFARNLDVFETGNKDGVVIIAELVGPVLEGPEGEQQSLPRWAPDVLTRRDDDPRALDFTGLEQPDPSDDLRVATLIEGDGPVVTSGNVARVNYLGQVFGTDEPFDASFGQEPLEVAIGEDVEGLATPVIEGWSQGLEGVTVGSRVIIQIPPRLGYGEEQGNPDAGIGPEDTMYFLVDVLGTA